MLPTRSGKTSIIAIWLIALAEQSVRIPRRLVYVVNRRTIVDQTTDEVEKLRRNLDNLGLLQEARRLTEAALMQSGPEQPCEFEWSNFSRFPKSFSAHKYGRDGKPAGSIRPNYLYSQTATHLTLRFRDELKVPGPIAIGASRHCSFGLMVGVAE